MTTRIQMTKTLIAVMCLCGAAAWVCMAGLSSPQVPMMQSMQDTSKPKLAPRAPAEPSKPTTPAAPRTTTRSLFDRLGGTYPVVAMVDDYVNRLPADPVIMANPQLKAAIEKAVANNGLPGLKFQISAFVIQAIGGPYTYHGRTMKESHKDLRINQSEWDAGVEVFKATLNKFKVPAKDQDELIAAIGTTHDDIVVGSSSVR